MRDDVVDVELVRRAQQGERGAFDALVRRYQGRIVKLVGRYVRNPDDALDVAQDAFVRAWRGLANFREDSAFYTWLYRIAINTAKNHLVSPAARRAGTDLDLDAVEETGIDVPRLRSIDSPDRLALRDEMEAVIYRTIAGLPEDLRTAITLREFDGMSYEDIARTMACPIGTVRSRIFRAREAIDAQLRELTE